MQLRMTMTVAITWACSLACSAPTDPPPTAPTPTLTSSSSAPDPSPQPPAPAEPATTAATSEVTCLMRRVCGCNLGCAGIRASRDALEAGMPVHIAVGVDQGQDAYIEAAPAQGGGTTLVIGRDPPDMAYPCALPNPSPWLAYPCSTEGSGPVPQDACAAGCPNL